MEDFNYKYICWGDILDLYIKVNVVNYVVLIYIWGRIY